MEFAFIFILLVAISLINSAMVLLMSFRLKQAIDIFNRREEDDTRV